MIQKAKLHNLPPSTTVLPFDKPRIQFETLTSSHNDVVNVCNFWTRIESWEIVPKIYSDLLYTQIVHNLKISTTFGAF